MDGAGTGVRVRCTNCSFERIVRPDDDVKPADVLIEHGQRTGHTLTIERLESGED